VETKLAFSSGGVIFRENEGKIEIALIARENSKIWCLPKGTIEKGESLEETALREVAEETGLEGEIVKKIGKIEYWFYWKPHNTRYHKFVYFFLMRYLKGDPQNHDWEVDEVRWFPLEGIFKVLTYRSERDIVKKAQKLLAEATKARKNTREGKNSTPGTPSPGVAGSN